MANAQDERIARHQALDQAVKEKLTTEQQQARERQILEQLQKEREQQQRQGEREQRREAHEAALAEAKAKALEQEGAQRIKLRTEIKDDQLVSRGSIRSGGRSRDREQRQFSQSGDPIQLEGDPGAIQQLRFQAFQVANRKAQQRGETLTSADINRETRNLLASSGGRITFTDPSSNRDAVNAAYNNFKGGNKSSVSISDDVILTPVSGIRSRSVTEGFDEAGQKHSAFIVDDIDTVSKNLVGNFTVIQKPRVETVDVVEPPPPNDPLLAIGATFRNVLTDWELGTKGIGVGLGSLFGGDSRQSIKDAERLGTAANLKTERELEGELVGSGIQAGVSLLRSGKADTSGFDQLSKGFAASPLYFLGSGAASAALWLTPAAFSKISRIATTGLPKIPGYLKPEVVSTRPARAIQAARPETSIFRYYVNYEKAPELRSIARTFDQESPVRSGSISVDEVTLTKEFERAPFGRFVTESRPRLVGERMPLTIDEELGMVKLNPSRPQGLRPTFKSDIVEVPKASGAPFKTPESPFLKPALGDIMKQNLWSPPGKTQGAPFKVDFSQQNLPRLVDIVKPDDITPRSASGSPFKTPASPYLLPELGDILRTDLFRSASARGAPFKQTGAASYGYALPKYGDLFPELFRARKPKGDRSLSSTEIADLFETLEGKREIGTARDLLTRREQGRLSGDISETSIADVVRSYTGRAPRKPAKEPKKTETEKQVEKLVKESTGQTTVTVKRSQKGAAPSLPTIKGIDITPGGFASSKEGSSIFGYVTAGRRRRNQEITLGGYDVVRYPPSTGRQSDIFARYSSAKHVDNSGFSQMLKNLQGSGRSSIKIDQSLIPVTFEGQRSSQRTSSLFGSITPPSFPTGSRNVTIPTPSFRSSQRFITITNIPPPKPFFDIPVGDSPKRKKKGRKRKVKYVKRTQRLTSPLSAVIGINTPIGKEIQKFTERYT